MIFTQLCQTSVITSILMGLERQLSDWRALSVLQEDLGSVSWTHTAAYNHLQLQFQGIWCHFSFSSSTRYLNGEQTCMQGKHPYAIYDLDRMFVTYGKDQNLNPGTHIKLDMAVRRKLRQEDPQKLAYAMMTTRRYFRGGGSTALINHSIREEETGGSLNPRPVYSTKWVPGQPTRFTQWNPISKMK